MLKTLKSDVLLCLLRVFSSSFPSRELIDEDETDYHRGRNPDSLQVLFTARRKESFLVNNVWRTLVIL